MGGLEPPPPPLATLLGLGTDFQALEIKVILTASALLNANLYLVIIRLLGGEASTFAEFCFLIAYLCMWFAPKFC